MAGKANTPPPSAGELYYQLPESAHEALGHIRDELGMLAHLALRTCCNDEHVLQLPATALSQCFARLAVEIVEVMDECLSPTAYAASVQRSRR